YARRDAAHSCSLCPAHARHYGLLERTGEWDVSKPAETFPSGAQAHVRESRSGGLSSESAEGQPCGVLPGRNHSLDRQRTGQIARKRNLGLDEKIGATDSGVVVRRVSTTRPGMMRINAEPAQ